MSASVTRLFSRQWLSDGASLVVSPFALKNAPADLALFELAEQLAEANYVLKAARTALARAERRWSCAHAGTSSRDIPDWLEASESDEASAEACVETLHQQIADTRAFSRAGLAIKLRLLAALYGDDPTSPADDDAEITSALLHSIIADVSG